MLIKLLQKTIMSLNTPHSNLGPVTFSAMIHGHQSCCENFGCGAVFEPSSNPDEKVDDCNEYLLENARIMNENPPTDDLTSSSMSSDPRLIGLVINSIIGSEVRAVPPEDFDDELSTPSAVSSIDDFVGKIIFSVDVDSCPGYDAKGDDADQMAGSKATIRITTTDGNILYLVAWNDHNGYYPHDYTLSILGPLLSYNERGDL
jgi:hypothetical protein